MIRISLLDNARPAFKALSYVWNDPNLKVFSSVSEDVTNDGVSVALWKQNENAIEALTWLSIEEDQLIWVDAFCINQQDEDEKSSQVSMMSQIYQSADEVVAWLGHAETEYMLGFDVLHSLVQFREDNQDEPWMRWYWREPKYRNDAAFWTVNASGDKVCLGELCLRMAQAYFPNWFDTEDQCSVNGIDNFKELFRATCK
ncbi:heterokaryon incompatibility protein [Stagonosporopsis vannaccii]|nr:heterokaryon incompatibility protein [Stagonosporopsis vannaccii]